MKYLRRQSILFDFMNVFLLDDDNIFISEQKVRFYSCVPRFVCYICWVVIYNKHRIGMDSLFASISIDRQITKS